MWRVLVVSIVLTLAGCSSAETTENLPLPGVAADYDPYPNPRVMLRAVDVAIVGDIVSVDPALLAGETEPEGAAIVGVQPREVWKDDPTRATDIVYFELYRPREYEIGRYRDALPTGTEIALFGGHIPEPMDYIEGDPGDLVYGPAPQGLFISDPTAQAAHIWSEDLGPADWPGIHDLADLRAALGK